MITRYKITLVEEVQDLNPPDKNMAYFLAGVTFAQRNAEGNPPAQIKIYECEPGKKEVEIGLINCMPNNGNEEWEFEIMGTKN